MFFAVPNGDLCCLVLRSIVPATGSHRIFQERCGKVNGSCRKTREIPGTWKQYSSREFLGFFPMISGRILPEGTGSCWNPPEKIREILDRNTASNFLVFSVASPPFPAVRRSPGYVVIKKLFKRVDL
jgi:hypothetical protein